MNPASRFFFFIARDSVYRSVVIAKHDILSHQVTTVQTIMIKSALSPMALFPFEVEKLCDHPGEPWKRPAATHQLVESFPALIEPLSSQNRSLVEGVKN